MGVPRDLHHYLESWAGGDSEREIIKSLVCDIAAAGIRISRQIVTRELAIGERPDISPAQGDSGSQSLAMHGQQVFVDALSGHPVSTLVSALCEEPLPMDPQGRYAVAIDPLDGAPNLETNLSIGSVFSILESDGSDLVGGRPGQLQRAAGFLYYGPQTRLVLSCGEGTHQFLLDPERARFHLLHSPLRIPPGKYEFAINTANYRFWDNSMRYFIDDCIAGDEGALGENFNMRWSGSLVAEAYRILVRGGIFLYPGDSRPGYRNGRLRLLYHALPLAMIVEQAGGAASDGNEPILGMRLDALHARVPLIFGCSERVDEVIDYISGVALDSGHHPLFMNRGLLRK